MYATSSRAEVGNEIKSIGGHINQEQRLAKKSRAEVGNKSRAEVGKERKSRGWQINQKLSAEPAP